MYTAPTNYRAIKPPPPPSTTIKTVNKNVARAKLHQFPRQKRMYCTLSASLWEPGALLPGPETIVKECNDCYWCVFSKLVHPWTCRRNIYSLVYAFLVLFGHILGRDSSMFTSSFSSKWTRTIFNHHQGKT